MRPVRRLTLSREPLAELTRDELHAAVAGRIDEGPSQLCISIPECVAGTLLPPCYGTLGYPCCDSVCCTG